MKQSSSTFKKPTTEKTIKLDDDYDNERVIIHETDLGSVKKFQSKEFVPNQMSVAASFLSSDWKKKHLINVMKVLTECYNPTQEKWERQLPTMSCK